MPVFCVRFLRWQSVRLLLVNFRLRRLELEQTISFLTVYISRHYAGFCVFVILVNDRYPAWQILFVKVLFSLVRKGIESGAGLG